VFIDYGDDTKFSSALMV